MERAVLDVTRLVDEQRVGAFTIRVVLLSFLVMLMDGYDLLAASYGAPALIADWHVQPSQLGPVFSASPFGMIVGSPLLGWLGDRLGRRRAIILGAVLFGCFTLVCATATSITELMVLRFMTGIGLGGMMPNITALNAEFAPQRLRATLVVLMFSGVTGGQRIAGLGGDGASRLWLAGPLCRRRHRTVAARGRAFPLAARVDQISGVEGPKRLPRADRTTCPQGAA